MRYLVDHPVQPYFPHIAVCDWPVDPRHHQQDWVNAVATLELWLHAYIGPHYSHWVYATRTEQEYWQACVGFSQAKHKSIFLLRWG
jgi:hypothetical protein